MPARRPVHHSLRRRWKPWRRRGAWDLVLFTRAHPTLGPRRQPATDHRLLSAIALTKAEPPKSDSIVKEPRRHPILLPLRLRGRGPGRGGNFTPHRQRRITPPHRVERSDLRDQPSPIPHFLSRNNYTILCSTWNIPPHQKGRRPGIFIAWGEAPGTRTKKTSSLSLAERRAWARISLVPNFEL